MNDENLNKAKEVYIQLVNQAFKKISEEIVKDAKIYYGEQPKKQSTFKKFNRKIISTVFRLDQNFWNEVDEEIENEYATRCDLAEKYARDVPERADEINGMVKVCTALHIMQSYANGVNKKAALSFMKTFYEIYEQNPNITDIDAVITFTKQEKVIGNKAHLAMLDKIPNSAKVGVDLKIKENLRKFAEEYTQDLNQEETPRFGGR